MYEGGPQMLEEIIWADEKSVKRLFAMDPQEHVQKMLDGFEKGIYIYIYIYIYIIYIILIVFSLSTYIVFEFHTL